MKSCLQVFSSYKGEEEETSNESCWGSWKRQCSLRHTRSHSFMLPYTKCSTTSQPMLATSWRASNHACRYLVGHKGEVEENSCNCTWRSWQWRCRLAAPNCTPSCWSSTSQPMLAMSWRVCQMNSVSSSPRTWWNSTMRKMRMCCFKSQLNLGWEGMEPRSYEGQGTIAQKNSYFKIHWTAITVAINFFPPSTC